MLFYKCPSCGTEFANKQLLYENLIEKICNDNSLTHEQKEKEQKEQEKIAVVCR